MKVKQTHLGIDSGNGRVTSIRPIIHWQQL